MRTIVIITAAAGLFAAALPAQAADTNGNTNANRSDATAREQPQANGAGAADRRICVRDTRSESHIRRTICHSAREWRNLEGGLPGEN
jgi:hypothetical protein